MTHIENHSGRGHDICGGTDRMDGSLRRQQDEAKEPSLRVEYINTINKFIQQINIHLYSKHTHIAWKPQPYASPSFYTEHLGSMFPFLYAVLPLCLNQILPRAN